MMLLPSPAIRPIGRLDFRPKLLDLGALLAIPLQIRTNGLPWSNGND
ncbi:MAG: hypothetical protein Q8O52_14310 [Sulfuritalea sp.]|nr:hypothetical protein [Sulfuritalea sp.]